MIKKLFGLFFILALTVGVMGTGYATDDNPDSENVFDIHRFGGSSGVTPPTMIVKVRYGHGSADAASLSSGDVVVWDTNSRDGYTISLCQSNQGNAVSYAGVLVTTIGTAYDTVVRGNGRNIGYMATKGYVLAKVDTSAADSGQRLTPNGATLAGSFATMSPSNTAVIPTLSYASMDSGVLLYDTGADGIMPVILQ